MTFGYELCDGTLMQCTRYKKNYIVNHVAIPGKRN